MVGLDRLWTMNIMYRQRDYLVAWFGLMPEVTSMCLTQVRYVVELSYFGYQNLSWNRKLGIGSRI